MRKSLFLYIMEKVEAHDNYFKQKPDCTVKMGLSCLQKCTAALRIFAYGTSYDSTNEYIRISETTSAECTKHFCLAIIQIFGEVYLRSPNEEDVKKLYKFNEKRGFPGLLGSIDCMHWFWKNCPKAWHAMFIGKDGKPSIVLEATASYDGWIWHSFFGTPGSCNDINIIDRSNVLKNIFNGSDIKIPYELNGTIRSEGYWLADGIYPEWKCFVKTINKPEGEKYRHFARMQEAFRKDVERSFGMLQGRFKIISQPSRLWMSGDMKIYIEACIILHNMIIEDERDEVEEDLTMPFNMDYVLDEDRMEDDNIEMIRNSNSPIPGTLAYMLSKMTQLSNKNDHYKLRNDIIEHLWKKGHE